MPRHLATPRPARRHAGLALTLAGLAAAGPLAAQDEDAGAAARRASATVEPAIAGSRDSDGNRVWRVSLAATRQASPTVRLRVEGAVEDIADLAGSARTADGGIGLRWQPRATLVVEPAVGVTMVGAPADTVVRYVMVRGARGQPPQAVAVRELAQGGTTAVPTGRLRLRWRAPADGAALTIVGQHAVVDATPLLVASQVTRSEASAALDLPLAGPLRLRGGGALAALDSRVDARRRHVLDLGLALRARPWLDLAVQGRTLGVDAATTAGWFAPRRGDLAELAATIEWESAGGAALSADLGAGAQRVTRHDEPTGDWARALRGWAAFAWPLAPRRGLRLEVEAYDTLVGSVAGTAGGWRYGSVSVGGYVGL